MKNHKRNNNNIIKLIIILIVIIIILGGFYIYLSYINRANTIREDSLNKIKIEEVPTEVDFSYYFKDGKLPNLSQIIPVYRLNNWQGLTDDIIKNIASNLGFSLESLKKFGTNYLFREENRTILFEEKTGLVEYNFEVDSNLGSKLTEEELLENANSFISKSGLLPSSLILKQSKLIYYQEVGLNLLETNNKSESKFLGLYFDYYFNSYPVIDSVDKNHGIFILVNWDGTIKKMSASYLGNAEIKEVGTSKLIQLNKSLEAISQGQGIISLINDPNNIYTNVNEDNFIQNIPELGSIEIDKNIIFDNAEIVYIWNREKGEVQPYYRFKGTLDTAESNGLIVEVIIQALPDKLYKQE